MCLLVVAGWGPKALAQNRAQGQGPSSPEASAETVPYRQFTPSDGLPHATVRHLAQTPDGQLWIGTNAGLAVYDGHEIRTVSLPDSIGQRAVGNLFVQENGPLWAEIIGRGLVALRDGHVTRVFSTPESPNNTVRLLARRDTVFAVTATALWTLPPGADTFTKTPYTEAEGPSLAIDTTSLSGPRVVATDRAPNGTLWVLVSQRGLARLAPDGSLSFVDVSLPMGSDPSRLNLRFVDDGSAFVATWAGAYRFVPSTETLRRLSSHRYPWLSSQGNTVYAVRPKRVERWNVHTGRAQAFGPDLGLPETEYYTALEGESGDLWMGTLHGLLHLPAPDVRTLTAADGTSIRWATNFSVDASRGEVWMATWGRGLFRVTPTPMHAPPRRANGEPFAVNGRWSVLVRRQPRDVEALSAAGWFRRTEAGWRRLHSDLRATNGYIDTTGAGVFWTNHGICRVRPSPGAPVDTLWHWSYPEASQHRFAPLDDGTLLLRTHGKLVHLSPYADAEADTVASFPQYASAEARRMIVLNDRAWLGTGGKGLLGIDFRGDTTRTTRLLPEQRSFDLSTVGDSLLLVGSDTGLYLLDPETGTVRRHLTRADGLLSNTAGGRFFRDTLYVAHPYGVTKLPRSVVQNSPRAPRPKITSWSAEGEQHMPVDSARLAVGQRTLEFRFAGVHLVRGADVRYAYRLVPYDTTWHGTQDRLTRYTDLPPGSYTFQVRARLRGAPTKAPASLHVTLPRAYYETTWFRLLCGLGVLGLIGGGYLLRVRALRRRKEELQALVAKRTRRLAEEKEKTEQQAERLADLDEEKNRFFADISHELRTPLTLLIGVLDDALDGAFGAVPAPLRQQLEIVRGHAHRIQRLTEQLLDLSRLESTEPGLAVESRDLVGFVRRLVRAFVPLAERQGVTLDLETALDVHPCRFDPEKLEKVVSNLLSNALKFTPGGGQVTVRVCTEPAGEAGEPPVAVVQVADTGPGIPDDRQEEIFERFAHASPQGEEQTGTGVGLALAYELTQMHGGTIDLESAPGEGSTFTVRLPLPLADAEALETPTDEESIASVPPAEAVRPAAAGDDPSGGEASRPNVSAPESERPLLLVVEDDADVRAYLRRHLSDVGRVIEAANGAEGLETIREATPDLILADVMMPELDGLELTRRLRADDDLDRIPLLLLTARADEQTAVEGLEAGADDYVTKPFSVDEVCARVEQLLAARQAWTGDAAPADRLLAPEVEVTPDEEVFLNRVTDAIEDHLSRTSFTVDDLASEVGLSRRQLHRKLKRLTGHAPAAFVRRYRLECAAELLAGGDGTVAQVAYRVGFGTPETFVKHFREHFECRPSAYAERHGEEPPQPPSD